MESIIPLKRVKAESGRRMAGTWQGGAVRPGRGAAPDVLKIGDRYLVAYSATVVDWGQSSR